MLIEYTQRYLFVFIPLCVCAYVQQVKLATLLIYLCNN